MNPEIFAEKIYYYKNVIDSPTKLVEILEDSDSRLTEADAIDKWHEWTASGNGEKYVFGKQKFTDERKLDSSSGEVKLLYSALKDALTKAGQHYAEEQGLEYIEPSPLSIAKYTIGAEMGPHVDYYGDPHTQPIMSGVLYLNDDCKGGELSFPDFGVTIKPEAGSIIIFPSVEPFYHQSMPILSGHKLMAPVFWIKQLP